MKIKSIMECDRKSAKKFYKIQLPNTFKKVGWIIFFIAFAGLFIVDIIYDSSDLGVTLKSVAKYVILVGLLVVSLSREKIEDEYIKSLRMHSYMFAFVFGVIQSLVFPFIKFGAENLFSSGAPFEESGDFFIIWVLLFCQIMYFHVLKSRLND